MIGLVNRDSSSRCKTGRGELALSAIVSARGRGLLTAMVFALAARSAESTGERRGRVDSAMARR
ncbi:hypothetical protein D1O30_17685 [Methylocystis hirsuta]|uniref:Uncharacterized protein n=1 Tax=Methylocystis hirsuta TaxID=369798 RepID=A0A3M9XS87_9HYPH|nr:hypothetical protein D1O30_17685 [Methylocystis hirsuta]